MTEERITERTDGVTSERVTERTPTAAPASTTYVEKRGGGATGIIVALAVLALVALAAWYFLNANRQQEARTESVSEAAESVGNAAESVGNAAEGVVDRVAPN